MIELLRRTKEEEQQARDDLIRKRSSRDKGSAPSAPLAQSEEEEEDLSELIKQRDEWKEKVDEQRRIAEKLEAEIEELEASLAT
mmetsp:Transcript_12090/g.42050  ORF Transcript_12090/g.42050 Transcript_12090/m.42050 type:complete len:84 (+) Transcript_12090:584-835(+)